MTLKIFLIRCVSIATIVVLILILVLALVNGGELIVPVNLYNEAGPEIGILVLVLVLDCQDFRRELKQAARRKKKKGKK